VNKNQEEAEEQNERMKKVVKSNIYSDPSSGKGDGD